MSFLYLILIALYSLYSFSQTDPNLTYSGNYLFQKFQNLLWQLGLDNRLASSIIYFLIITALFVIYRRILLAVQEKTLSLGRVKTIMFGSIILLLLANPALSHDLFNYLFNAKMVAFYHADPHQATALQFGFDPWTRFMRNTHTPAPYGYGWTALSLLPYYFGLSNFKLTLLSFKLFGGLFFALLVYSQRKLQILLKIKYSDYKLAAFILNPLVLIETFGNGHNDVVMMGLGLFALVLFYRFFETRKPLWLLGSLFFLGISISIKFASLAMIGGLGLWWLAQKLKNRLGLGEANALALFSPLLTTRSQQFLPWYLIWPLSFLPIISNPKIINILLVFSYFSLLRYLPVIYLPMFDRPISDGNLRLLEIAISFIFPLIYLGYKSLPVRLAKKSR